MSKNVKVIAFALSGLAITLLYLNDFQDESLQVIEQPSETVSEVVFLETAAENTQEAHNHTQCQLMGLEPASGSLDKTYRYVESLIKSLQNQQIEEPVIDYIASVTKIGVHKARELRDGYTFPVTIPFKADNRAKLASSYESGLVQDFQQSGDIAPIIEAIRGRKISADSFYPGIDSRSLQFLLGIVIESSANINEDIRALLDEGLEAKLTDLMHASRYELSLDVLKAMHAASNIDVKVPFYFRDTFFSLATYAFANQSIDHAMYWMGEGGLLNPDPYSFNALDFVLKDSQEYKEEELLSILGAFMEAGLTPNYMRTPQEVENLLGDRVSTEYIQSLLGPRSFALTFSQLTEANKVSESIFSEVVSINQPNAANELADCHKYLGQKYITLALTYYQQKKNTENNEAITNIANKRRSLESAKLSAVSLDYTHSLAYKTEQRRAKLEELIKDIEEKESSKQNNDLIVEEALKDIIVRVIALLKNQQWYDALEVLQSSKDLSIDGVTYSLMLNISLTFEPPLDFIQYLTQQGATANDYFITSLIKNDNVELLDYLLDYGLNLNYVDPLGDSTLTLAVKSRAQEVIVYLLDNGVREPEQAEGLDALDVALSNFRLRSTDDYFVRVLINSGFRIEVSHKELVSNLFDTNIEAYSYLVNTYPGLKF